MAGRKSAAQIEKEHLETIEFIKNIKTVKDLIKWKNGKYYSVEKYNSESTSKLEWELTDVLYSFLSVYAIGMLAFYPDRYRKTDYMIWDRKTNSNVYTKKFISDEFENCKELNDFLENRGFISHYFDIGNVIPIWPGGSKDKGTTSVFDLPEIYFGKKDNMIWTQVLREIYRNSFLDEVINTAWICDTCGEYINSPPMFNFYSTYDFLNSVCDERYPLDARQYLYRRFLDRIMGIIEKRNRQLKDWMIEKDR